MAGRNIGVGARRKAESAVDPVCMYLFTCKLPNGNLNG